MFYADINGSSPIYPIVEEKLQYLIKERIYANPNANHPLGQFLAKEIETSRSKIADILGAHPEQIIFNSGASEGLSHIFYALLDPWRHKPKKIVLSRIEHSCIIKAAQYYEKLGFTLCWVDVGLDGVVNTDQIHNYLREFSNEIAFVCVMAANNETGVLQPIETIGHWCQEYSIPFVCDTTQYIGKIDFSFQKLPIDYAVCSSHKIGSLIGSGFILSRNPNISFQNFIFGGGQEMGNRGGTQNYLGIIGMSSALEYFHDNKLHLRGIEMGRNKLENSLKSICKDVIVFGQNSPRLAGTCYWGIPKIPGFIIQEQLQKDNIYVSTTSACSDAKGEGSRVLKMMGYNDNVAKSAVRISFCLNHSDDDFAYLEQKLRKTLHY